MVLLDGKPIAEVLPKLYRTMSLSEIVLKYGGSRSTLHSWVSKLGLKHDEETKARLRRKQGAKGGRKPYHRRQKTYCGMVIQDIVRKYFPVMSSREIKDKFGCPDSYVRTVARELNISHTEETKARLIAYRQKMIPHPKKTDEQIDFLSYWHTQTYKMERFRLENGLPRKTKIQINIASPHIRKLMQCLCARRGYYRNCRIDSYTLFYDDETRRDPPRCRRTEAYYTERYGIKFAPGEGYHLNKKDAIDKTDNED